MDGSSAEEQDQELEALEAIFAEDFELIEPRGSQHGGRFSVSISDTALKVDAKLVFCFPHSYPSEAPSIVLHSTRGISGTQRQKMCSYLKERGAELVGTPMVFALHGIAKEWMEEHLVGEEGIQTEQEEDHEVAFETRDTTAERRVELIQSKVIGTPVTVESFMAWREKFNEEFEGSQKRKKADEALAGKLTGRELFEQGQDVLTEDNISFWEEQAELFEDEMDGG